MGLMLKSTPNGEDTLKWQLAQLIWHKPRHRAEQQRLYYVALTRAKHGPTPIPQQQKPRLVLCRWVIGRLPFPFINGIEQRRTCIRALKQAWVSYLFLF
jgi:hypothetical protein